MLTRISVEDLLRISNLSRADLRRPVIPLSIQEAGYDDRPFGTCTLYIVRFRATIYSKQHLMLFKENMIYFQISRRDCTRASDTKLLLRGYAYKHFTSNLH